MGLSPGRRPISIGSYARKKRKHRALGSNRTPLLVGAIKSRPKVLYCYIEWTERRQVYSIGYHPDGTYSENYRIPSWLDLIWSD